MAKVENIDPRLTEAGAAMVIANIDFEDNKGNSRLAPIFWQKFLEARWNFRAKKAELEKEPVAP